MPALTHWDGRQPDIFTQHIIIINLTPFEPKAMRVSYKSLKLGKTLLLP
jgi:hypothetical protein